MKFFHRIFLVCLFTSSCDVILVLNLGGSIRLSQILLLVIFLAASARSVATGRIAWATGSTSLLIWLTAQFLLLLHVPLNALAMQLSVLLAFTIAGVFACVQLYADSHLVPQLMKGYLLSFFVIACFGLLQFILPLVGLPAPFMAQWLVVGKAARINGFNYEPSYFATYLILGWIILLELRHSKAALTSGSFWKWATIVVTAALFFSTSKTAWIFMALEGALRATAVLWRRSRSFLRRSATGTLLLRKPRLKLALLLTGLPLLAVIGLTQLSRVYDPVNLLSGTGLGNTASHSLNDRSQAALNTFELFKQSPWLGYSLGGVPIAIAADHGFDVSTSEDLRRSWGFPVPLEVLAASGIIGFIPFACFTWAMTGGAFHLARMHFPGEEAKWLRALARAMVYEWLTLLADQNLLRVYFWFHVTLIMIVAYHLRHSSRAGTPQSLADGSVTSPVRWNMSEYPLVP